MDKKSVFFPTESDLYDAIFSNSQKVTTNYLLDRLRERGIFLSTDEEREYLSRYLSLLDFDYFQFKNLSSHIARTSRSDKATNTVIDTSLSPADLTAAFGGVKALRGAKSEVMNIKVVDNKTTRIYLTYDEIDHSRTKIIQKVTSEGYIDVITTDAGTKLRYSASPKVAEIVTDLVGQISAVKKAPVTSEKIDFKNIIDTELRTRFFIDLISAIFGHRLIDVIRIQLGNGQADIADSFDEREDLSADLAGEIRRASFDGKGLLGSELYQQLQKRGYFLTSIRWICEETGTNPCQYEIEAYFHDQEACSDFRYQLRNVIRPKTKGGHTGPRPPKDDETALLLGRVEVAAAKIFKEINESLVVPE